MSAEIGLAASGTEQPSVAGPAPTCKSRTFDAFPVGVKARIACLAVDVRTFFFVMSYDFSDTVGQFGFLGGDLLWRH